MYDFVLRKYEFSGWWSATTKHYRGRSKRTEGALDGGPQCPLSLILNVPIDFKGVQCRLSILRNDRVALSNSRVKGHTEVWTARKKIAVASSLAVGSYLQRGSAPPPQLTPPSPFVGYKAVVRLLQV